MHMDYHATDRMGATVDAPDLAAMRELLCSLEGKDEEHPDVSLTHGSGWTLSVHAGGLVVWENIETDEGAMHTHVSLERALAMWQLLAQGRVDEVGALGWLPGYGTPRQRPWWKIW